MGSNRLNSWSFDEGAPGHDMGEQDWLTLWSRGGGGGALQSVSPPPPPPPLLSSSVAETYLKRGMATYVQCQ